jgi:hypothetical protein
MKAQAQIPEINDSPKRNEKSKKVVGTDSETTRRRKNVNKPEHNLNCAGPQFQELPCSLLGDHKVVFCAWAIMCTFHLRPLFVQRKISASPHHSTFAKTFDALLVTRIDVNNFTMGSTFKTLLCL